MSLQPCRNQLATLTRDLLQRWEETGSHWRDSQRQEFEARFMSALELQVTATLTAMEKLDKLIASVRSDCE